MAILGSAKDLDPGRRGHRVGHQNKPIRSSGCERSGNIGTQVYRCLAATEAQLGGPVDPNRHFWLNLLHLCSRMEGWDVTRPWVIVGTPTSDNRTLMLSIGMLTPRREG